MKSHLINFVLLFILELGLAGAGIFMGIRFRDQSQGLQKQADIMRQAHNVFLSDENALAAQAAEGAAYREYKAQWEARIKEYDAPSKVLEVLNAEASRAGVSSPRLNDSKGVANAFDITAYGRLNDLTLWLAATESRIDLLIVDELVLSSQVDAALSLTVRARMVGDITVNPVEAPAPPAGARRSTGKTKTHTP